MATNFKQNPNQQLTKRQLAHQYSNSPKPEQGGGFDIGGFMAEQEAAQAAMREQFMQRMEELNRVNSARTDLAGLLGQRNQYRAQLPDLSVSEYKARMALEDAQQRAAQAESAKITGGGRGSIDLSPFEEEYNSAQAALQEIQNQMNSVSESIYGKARDIGEDGYYKSMFGQEEAFDPESILGADTGTGESTTLSAAQQAATPTIDNMLSGVFAGQPQDESAATGRKSTNRIF